VAQDQTTGDSSEALPAAGAIRAEEPAERDPPRASGETEDDVEALLRQVAQGPESPGAASGSGPTLSTARSRPSPETTAQPDDVVIGEKDIEFLFNQAQQALGSIDEAQDHLPEGVKRFEWEDFSGTPASAEAATLDLVRDVDLDLHIELGRTHMHLADVLRLKKGSVVPLDKLAGDPVDIYVNDRLIARGEVLVLNDNFCVRVAELVVGDGANPI
jgi:flagellar motor switch protein FliN/FliY